MDTRLSNYLLPCLLWILIIPLAHSQLFLEPNCIGRFNHHPQRVCMNIRQCQPLLDQLMQFSKFLHQYFESTVCGCEDEDPLVCCPIDPKRKGLAQPSIESQYPINRTNLTKTSYGPLTFPYCGLNTAHIFNRVIGGEPADLGAWPWVAALGYKSSPDSQIEWKCGGSLISARHVLTAAHCVQGLNLSVVRLGDLDLDDNVDDGATPVDLGIEKATVHPEFNRVTKTNDVAVVKLARDVIFTDLIQPICLPVNDELQTMNLTEHYPLVVGWGASSYQGPSVSHLQQMQGPVVSLQTCQKAYPRPEVIDHRVICVGGVGKISNPCQGDSGGPLMYPLRESDYQTVAWYAIGIVSYSYRCALPGYPEVFMKVSEYLDFIMEHLN